MQRRSISGLFCSAAAALILAALFAFGAEALDAQAPSPGRRGRNREGAQQARAVEAYIDPNTGKLAVPPPSAAGADDLQARTADVRRNESRSPVQGGGYMLDLRGQQKFGIDAQVDVHGKALAHCDGATAVR